LTKTSGTQYLANHDPASVTVGSSRHFLYVAKSHIISRYTVMVDRFRILYYKPDHSTKDDQVELRTGDK